MTFDPDKRPSERIQARWDIVQNHLKDDGLGSLVYLIGTILDEQHDDLVDLRRRIEAE